jgi:hypothetical protein
MPLAYFLFALRKSAAVICACSSYGSVRHRRQHHHALLPITSDGNAPNLEHFVTAVSGAVGVATKKVQRSAPREQTWCSAISPTSSPK